MNKLISLSAAVIMAVSLSISPAAAVSSNQLLAEESVQANNCTKLTGVAKRDCLIRLLGSHQ
ncbi:hypothetical protein [Psychromonas aquimarina]|uniref:hypothetical protein n=1 Tax=Psychromonas aquimarina TaxID=444919 RepID=UPI0012FB9317|nr:hypothetical protein [Psychromonas aquimarina]